MNVPPGSLPCAGYGRNYNKRQSVKSGYTQGSPFRCEGHTQFAKMQEPVGIQASNP